MFESKNTKNDTQNGFRQLINTGAEIAGGAVAGALGFLAGSPSEAAMLGIGGTAAAAVLKHIGQETAERLLGPREQVRVGAVLALAASEIHQRLKQGESVRTDGFFTEKDSSRSDGEEVAESVLLKSQREPEEKKLPYMAHLFAAVAFDAQISVQLAHQIIKTSEQLTYRQLCILKLGVVKQHFALRTISYRNDGGNFERELYQVLYECLDLFHRGLINFGSDVAFGPTDVNPGSINVQGLGADIFNLMKLHLIPNEDLGPIAAQMR